MSVVLVLLGPTASGKTDVAMALADARPVELISMDSAMVYQGMDIGTAKPSPQTLAAYPHGLVDIRDPAQAYSAAQFVADADVLVRQALAAQRLPVLVGGTMLYAKAFRDGLSDLPSADESVRASLAARAEQEGWPALHAELVRIDPVAAAKIDPNNTQRLQRALEVYAVTGKPLSWWWQEHQPASAQQRLPIRLLQCALPTPSRAALHWRIEQRFDAMVAAGFVAEVAALRERPDLHLGLPALRAVGYRQVWEHLDGTFDAKEMRMRAIAATRQLAKRQLTWLRRWPELHYLQTPTANDRPNVEESALELLRLCDGA